MPDSDIAKQIIYESWCRNAGLPPLSLWQRRQRSEWSPVFYQLMRNRLVMGSFRYETFEDRRKKPRNYDTAEECVKRIRRYQKDGNVEHLVDAANMCLIEFEFGNHPNKHFESVDDGVHAEAKRQKGMTYG